MVASDERVCLKELAKELAVVNGRPQYCSKPAWIEPGGTRHYYIYIQRPGREDQKINLCYEHAIGHAEDRYATMWDEVQALQKDPGLNISEDRLAFSKALAVLTGGRGEPMPTRGLLMAANARAGAFVHAAYLYQEDAGKLLQRYSGFGVEDLRVQERRIQELLDQTEALRFRLVSSPRGEKPYKEMHDLASTVRDAARTFYRRVVAFPDLQPKLIADQERREVERKVREEEARRRVVQRRLLEGTRDRLYALLNFPSTPNRSSEGESQAAEQFEPSANGGATGTEQVGEAPAPAPAQT